jgi:hypothetical protein
MLVVDITKTLSQVGEAVAQTGQVPMGHRDPSGEMPPPVTIICTSKWWVIAGPNRAPPTDTQHLAPTLQIHIHCHHSAASPGARDRQGASGYPAAVLHHRRCPSPYGGVRSCLVPRPTIAKDRLTLGMVSGHLPLTKVPRPAGPPTSSSRPLLGSDPFFPRQATHPVTRLGDKNSRHCQALKVDALAAGTPAP